MGLIARVAVTEYEYRARGLPAGTTRINIFCLGERDFAATPTAVRVSTCAAILVWFFAGFFSFRANYHAESFHLIKQSVL